MRRSRRLQITAHGSQADAISRDFLESGLLRELKWSRIMPKPVIWKPRYATRRMRERAWANADLRRERAAKNAPVRRSLLARLFRL